MLVSTRTLNKHRRVVAGTRLPQDRGVLQPPKTNLVDAALVAGKDYPRSEADFYGNWTEERACAAYLSRLGSRPGPACPKCHKRWRPKFASKRAICTTDGCEFAWDLIAGTAFEGTDVDLSVWFYAAWDLASAGKDARKGKRGISTKAMGASPGPSVDVMRTIVKKLREVMAAAESHPLSGKVAVGMNSLHVAKVHSVRVVVAVELFEPSGQGRMKARLLAPEEQLDLQTFFSQVAEPDAALFRWGIDHVENPPRKRDPVPDLCRKIQRWLDDTFSGALGPKLLQGYLDEFAFHFNQGSQTPVGHVFRRLLLQAMKAIEKKR